MGNDGPGVEERPGSPDSYSHGVGHGHGHGSSAPVRLHKRKARESSTGAVRRSHKKKVVEQVQQGLAQREQCPAADAADHEEVDEGSGEMERAGDELDGGTIAIAPRPTSVPRAHAQRHHHPYQEQDKPNSPLPSQPPPPAPSLHATDDSDSDHQVPPDSEVITARELSKQKTILYGYPISLLTSPTRNWMPILDKDSLIYQGISEIMTTCGLPNAVPMIARRLRWIGKGKVVHARAQRNRLGKFTKQRDRSGAGAGGKAPPAALPPATNPHSKDLEPNSTSMWEEWSLEAEQRKLLGGIIDLGAVVDGINRARANSSLKHNIVGHPDEFVDVDVPLEVLLAGTESIAFTDLGFYRIYVPEKNQPFPLREQSNRPSKLNWDLEASKVEADGDRRTGRRAPWTVTFLGYEWECVRMELLDEDDAEEEENKEWITTMAGYRVVRLKEEAASHSSAGGSGVKIPGEGHVVVASHPWGRDMLEPPPVGVYAQGEGYEDVVRNWFPWAWELAKEVEGCVEEKGENWKGGRKGTKRKAAVEAGKKVRNDAGGGGYGGGSGGGAGGKSGGRGKTVGGGYMKVEREEEQRVDMSPVRKSSSLRERECGVKKARV